MKTVIPLTFALALAVSACDRASQDKANVQTPVVKNSSAYHYRCESGERIAATYPNTDSASVEYQGSHYNMQIAVSASGSRYVGSGLEWWTKGGGSASAGTLFRHRADGTTGERSELCTQS